MCSSVLIGNSAQENAVPQTNRPGPEREPCSSTHPHTRSFLPFTAVQDTRESAYFSLLFLIQYSWNTPAVLLVSTFHSAPLQSCPDVPWPWPYMNSTTDSCACSNLRNYDTVFDSFSSSHFCPHVWLFWQFMAALQHPQITSPACCAKLSSWQESFHFALMLKSFCSICTRTRLL